MKIGTKQQLITLSVALGLFSTFMLGLVLPRSRTLGSIREEDSELRHNNVAQLQDIGHIDELHLEVQRLREEIETAELGIPGQDHFVEYENHLLLLGREYELWEAHNEPAIRESTRPRTDSDQGIHTRSMSVTFKSNFGKFFSFLRQLENEQTLTRIDAIDIAPDPDNPGSDVFLITLELSIFYGSL